MATRFITLTTPGGVSTTVHSNEILTAESTGYAQSLVSLANSDKFVHAASLATLLTALQDIEDDFRTVTQSQWYSTTKAGNAASVIVNLNAVVSSNAITGYPMADYTRVELNGGRTVDITDVAATFATLLGTIETETGGSEGGSDVLVTAGSGLIGGGVLSAPRRFDVVGVSGITVNDNNIETNGTYLATLYQLSGTGPVTSHGSMTDLLVDDHTQYVLHSALSGSVGDVTAADTTLALAATIFTAGSGLYGTGDLSAARTFGLDLSLVASDGSQYIVFSGLVLSGVNIA